MKPFAEACERNREPILAVLRQHFADRRRVLEIGSGTGQHAVHFAAALPRLTWQTSDLEAALPGIRLWQREARLANLPPPIALDVRGRWPAGPFDAAFTANTLHIMSWEDVEALFAALPGVLTGQALLAVYGPFNYGGRFTSASNEAFDAWLKRRSSASGIREFEAVDELARAHGFELLEDVAMPANNRVLLWRSTPASPPSDARSPEGTRISGSAEARGAGSSASPGRVRHDERGNAIWDWLKDTGRNALEATSRLLKKLEAPDLSIEDTRDEELRLESDRDPGGGYDPYNQSAKPRGRPREK